VSGNNDERIAFLLLEIVACFIKEQLLLASGLTLQKAKSLTSQMELVMVDIKALSQGISNTVHVTSTTNRLKVKPKKKNEVSKCTKQAYLAAVNLLSKLYISLEIL